MERKDSSPMAMAALRLLLALVLAFVVLATFLIVAAVPSAAANENCDLVLTPDAEFVWVDGTYSIEIEVDLSRNTVETIDASREFFLGETIGFPPDAIAQTLAYFDSLIDWYGYLDSPCAVPAVYEGPYANAPATPGAPYGFALNPELDGPVVIALGSPDGESVTVGEVADDSGLAHSGSESIVLVYFGIGLVAFGAATLGLRRMTAVS